MGYACPVCGTPQADQRHLADHVAMRAMTHGDDHEDWLDENVPDWVERGPADLGPLVAEAAPEADYPQVFEDTTGGHADHGHPAGSGTLEDHLSAAGRRGPGAGGRGEMAAGDADVEGVVSAAREMTREMLGADDPTDGDTTDATVEGDGSDGDAADATVEGDGSDGEPADATDEGDGSDGDAADATEEDDAGDAAGATDGEDGTDEDSGDESDDG